MYLSRFFLFVFLLGYHSILAQKSTPITSLPTERRPAGDVAFQPIRFEQLTTADGLPENSVLALLQDHLGFMWLGTQNGLVRYDGTTMTTFRYDPKKPFSLKGRQIGALHEDRNGDIWVGCESLFRYERATGRFIEYLRNRPKPKTGQADGDVRIYFLHEDRQGKLWTITAQDNFQKNVLDRLDPKTKKWTSFRHDPANPLSLASDDIYSSTSNIKRFSFAEAPNGQIWVVTRGATENILHGFDPKTNQFLRVRPKAPPAVLTAFRKAGFVLPVGGQVYVASYQNGLFRFTTQTSRLEQFKHDPRNPNSLYADSVSWLFKSRDGRLWVPTRKSVDRFEPKTGVFTHFVHNPKEPNTPSSGLLRGLHEMPNGDIWFVNAKGLNRYQRQSNRFERYEHDPAGGTGNFQGRTVFSFLVDKTGGVWAGSWGYGLNRQSRLARFPLLSHDSTNTNSLQSNLVLTVYEAPSQPGVIWFGSVKGLDRLDKKTGQYTHFKLDSLAKQSLGEGAVTALAEDKRGRFWVGTFRNGLQLMNRKTGHFTRFVPDLKKNPNESRFQSIRRLLPAHDGTIWIITDTELVHADVDGQYYQYHYETADTYSPALFDRLHELIRPQRQLAAIVHPQGKVDKTVSFVLNAPTDVCVVIGGSMRRDVKWDYGWIEDGQGEKVWEMTVENSKADSDPNHRVEIKTVRLPAGNYRLRYITDETFYYGNWPISSPLHADLWGVQVLRISTAEKGQLDRLLTQKYKRQGLSDNALFTLRQDRQGNIWTGTNTRGVCMVNPSIGRYQTWRDNLAGPVCVLSLLEDRPSGGWWVGDYLNGLLLLDKNGKLVRSYDARNGLAGNRVSAIQRDRQGMLWIKADNGLCRFNPQTEQFQIFTKQHGIPTEVWGVEDGSFQAKDGELYFWLEGEKGVVTFYPDQIHNDPVAPPVVLTDLLINGQPATLGEDGQLSAHVTVAKDISLPHDQNDLNFHFAALSYSRGRESKYAYQLAPIDTGWVQNGIIRQARFSDLRPGTYTFRVKAANADGVWNEQGTSLVVVIRPPWWQTWWAYVFYALGLGGGIWAFIRYRSRALVRENRELEEKVAQRTHQVQQQKNEIEQQKEEITAQRDHLEETLTELQATQAQLIQKEKLASLGELTAGIAHEIQNPLNFVNNFSDISAELVEELKEEAQAGHTEDVLAIANDLGSNLRKIHHHGGRAAAIVRGMLEHSRTDTGENRPTDLNALADEYLKIAYHGLRAKDKNFNCELVLAFDADLGRVEVVPQEIGRVLLNLYNNAFYAVSERAKTQSDGYQPTVSVSTKRLNNAVEICVSDNGTGIPDAVKAKIFQPFFTTKPTGEGTGLGLSLSYDIVTKGHGGALTVESKEGEGTTFTIRLPFALPALTPQNETV